MRIHLGPAGIPTITKGSTSLDGLKTVKNLGLQSMEIEFVRNVYMSNETAKEVGAAAKSLGIELSIHAPYFVNLCNPDKKKASMDRILRSCERAHYLRAETVVFHPGFYGKLSEEEAYQLVKKACKEMSETIEKNTWKVNLGLETTGKCSQFGTLDENIRISKEVNNCVPVIDFAHIFARQVGKIDYGKVFDKISTLKLKHLHTHFSGIEFTDKGERRHLTIDSKQPDFEKLAKEILNRKLDITIICESPVLEQDSLLMKKVFEKLGYNLC